MSHSLTLSRHISKLRAVLFASLFFAAACDNHDSFNPSSSSDPEITGQGLSTDDPMTVEETTAVALNATPLASASFSGGIPFGTTGQPTSAYGSRFNGALQTLGPQALMSELASVKSRGGKVVLMFAGSQRNYKDAAGHFDFDKWKLRINRFRNINFTSYVNDGTIVGHYLLDEPYDPANWNGRVVPPSVVDEMGRYSKQLWPNMPTIVRAVPSYFSSAPRYVDAAWAQYLTRRGDVREFIQRNVADAQRRGLALVVGLNLVHGGEPNKTRMSAKQVEAYGSALLSSSYPCAFISWQYNSDVLNDAGMGAALDGLRRKAQGRSLRSCRN